MKLFNPVIRMMNQLKYALKFALIGAIFVTVIAGLSVLLILRMDAEAKSALGPIREEVAIALQELEGVEEEAHYALNIDTQIAEIRTQWAAITEQSWTAGDEGRNATN